MGNCWCNDPDCRTNGCKQLRGWPTQTPGYIAFPPPVPQGCICPPGANLTCRATYCPRRPIGSAPPPEPEERSDA